MEVRIKIDQIDRALYVYRPAAEGHVGVAAGVRIRLLGQRQSGVAHPRWSQASEEVIGTGERKPTLLFNGYGDTVADLYKRMDGERPWV